jgi:hypothetical protein
MSNSADRDEPDDSTTADAHLEEVPDGAGCTEIWETLSDHRHGRDTES